MPAIAILTPTPALSTETSTATHPQTCPATLPSFAIDARRPASRIELPPTLSEEESIQYTSWGRAFQAMSFQQGHAAALRALQNSRSPLDQAGTLFSALQMTVFVIDPATDNFLQHTELFTDAIEILRPLEPSNKRDILLRYFSLYALELELQEADTAIEVAWLMSDPQQKLEHLNVIAQRLRASGNELMAQHLDDQILAWLTTQPAYQAAVLAQVAEQYAQIQQHDRSQQTFQQAIDRLTRVPAGKQREAALQTVSHHLVSTGNFDLAKSLWQQMADPSLGQLELAIALAQRGQYQESTTLATQIQYPLEYLATVPALKQLTQTLIAKGQLNCALQVIFLPQVKEQALKATLPDLIPALIQAGQRDTVLKIGQTIEREPGSLEDTLIRTIAISEQPELALTWINAWQSRDLSQSGQLFDRFFALVTLAEVLAATKNTTLATQVLDQAEATAKHLLAEPVPSNQPAPPDIEQGLGAPTLKNNPAHSDYEKYSRLATHAQHRVTLAPIYHALGQERPALAMLNEALEIAFSPSITDPGVYSQYEFLAEQVLQQYKKLVEPERALAQITRLYRTSSRLPTSDLKTRHLRGFAYAFALFDRPDQAQESLPFPDLPTSAQQQIVWALARQGQLDIALELARQPQDDRIYNNSHLLETWAQLIGYLAIAENRHSMPSDRIDIAFFELSTRLDEAINLHFFESQAFLQQWLPKWNQYYAENRLYSLAQQQLLTYNKMEGGSPQMNSRYQDVNFPLLPIHQQWVKASEIAVNNGDFTASSTLIAAIPTPLDRIRGYTQLAIAFHTTGAHDLVEQPIQAAAGVAQAFDNNIAKAHALLAINQAQIQLAHLESVSDRLEQVTAILE